ncbi:MAG: hypothetical protein V4526_00795 [Patescibacteria group bacterium]
MNTINKIIAGIAFAAIAAFIIAPVVSKAQNGGDDEPSRSSQTTSNGSDDSKSPTHSGNGDDDGDASNPPRIEDSSSRRSGGRRNSGNNSGTNQQIVISNIMIDSAGVNKLRVQFSTSESAPSRLVFGTTAVAAPAAGSVNYGYQSGTSIDNGTTGHAFTVTIAPGQTYYFRPIALDGTQVVFGNEIKVAPNAPVGINGLILGASTGFIKPAVAGVKTPSVFALNNGSTTTGSTSAPKASNDLGAAAGAGAGTKVANFFKNLWNGIFAPICR